MKPLVLTMFLAFAAQNLAGQSPLRRAPQSAQVNPLKDDAAAVRAGQKLFERECAACHGHDCGGLGKAPALLSNVREAPAGAVFWVLRNGSLRHGMPSFAHLPETQRWQIVTYLQRR